MELLNNNDTIKINRSKKDRYDPLATPFFFSEVRSFESTAFTYNNLIREMRHFIDVR